MPRIFDGVAGNSPRLNRFDLSYTNTTSMSFGLLYPVQCDEVVPGDVWKMNCFCHAEVMPMVAPVMSDIQLFAHTFFVPYRIIYGIDNEDGLSIWEKYITGGKDGDYNTPLPAWVPDWTRTGFSSRTIWDQIGNPVSMSTSVVDEKTVFTWTPIVPPSRVSTDPDKDIIHRTVFNGLDVSIAPKYSYNAIYNAFYRDENLVDEVDKDNEDLLHVAFRKDYFTSALESQQRGTAPALPVDLNGNVPVSFSTLGWDPVAVNTRPYVGLTVADDGSTFKNSFSSDGVSPTSSNNPISASVDASKINATTFTVSDLRLAFAIQRMQELSMRAGYRYTEWLSAHFNAHPTDARLDRPEYIGGCVMNVSVSPVLQNSETASTPQGTKTGVGRVDSVQKIGNYRVLEHGLIMTLVSIRPKPIYQQGINRQWLRQSRFDTYMPETAFLSEQAIYNAEIWVDGTSGEGKDDDIFGYQAHWNEMRCKNNMVSGAVREQFDYWTLSRKFASRPALNQDFIEIDEKDFNKIFAVQDEDSFIVSWSNLIDAYRPIPAMGVPGLIDHVYGGF